MIECLTNATIQFRIRRISVGVICVVLRCLTDIDQIIILHASRTRFILNITLKGTRRHFNIR